MEKAKEAYPWVSFAVFSLVFAGIFALLVAVTRTPLFAIQTSKDYFYSSLAAHVIFSIVIWFLVFQVGIWHIAFPEVKRDKFSFIAVIAGSALIAFPALFGLGTPYMNNYVPVIGSPFFYLGLSLFGLAFLVNVFKYLPQARQNILSDDNTKQLASVSVIISFIMMASLIPSFIRAGGEQDMRLYFEKAFWIPGHIQQFLNASMMLIGWQFLLKIEGVETPASKWLKYTNIFFLVSALPLLYGLTTDPLSGSVQYAVLYSFGIGIGVPVLIHTVYLLSRFPKRLSSIAAQSLIFSLIVYYTGEVIAYLGLSGQDLRIPAHYHGVLTAATLTLMGMTFYIIYTVKGRVYLQGLAKLQPAIYGIGMMLFIAGLYFAGKMGASRKAYEFGYQKSSGVAHAMNLMGIGGGIAVIGGIFFVLYAAVSILKDKSHDKV
ncbi:MAG: cbb3-type cytochrome c oxidase subunit I [Nitrospirae bacterium]|nr:cbb3-type cytochrome c oxidase subunit I [Nitrospirota bacterium]